MIIVYDIGTPAEVVYTVVPKGTQSPFLVTVSPSPPPVVIG
jgi:hypothetical protein